jgi:hypothetical protein
MQQQQQHQECISKRRRDEIEDSTASDRDEESDEDDRTCELAAKRLCELRILAQPLVPPPMPPTPGYNCVVTALPSELASQLAAIVQMADIRIEPRHWTQYVHLNHLCCSLAVREASGNELRGTLLVPRDMLESPPDPARFMRVGERQHREGDVTDVVHAFPFFPGDPCAPPFDAVVDDRARCGCHGGLSQWRARYSARTGTVSFGPVTTPRCRTRSAIYFSAPVGALFREHLLAIAQRASRDQNLFGRRVCIMV